MNIFSIFSLLGGLAMFLYGMGIMGDGLEKLGGGKFERILEKFTNNPFKGVAVGALITAVIQSSSATTVMVVGFVNSGIMKLAQAIGIIMGANIGTTITSWILSLTGIQGDSFLINILKPANFTPVLAFVGILLNMAARTDKKKDIGSILLGFSVLMFGMNTMSDAVKPLAEVEGFTNILLLFKNPVLGVLAGAVLTAVIQSSSASVGILQALSATGAITFGSAIPIILGQNIGTCATALISCIGATRNAKRAAVVHLYFNIIGTVVFLLVFYIANARLNLAFVNDTVNAFNIAVVHTVFNVLATALLLPFNKGLEKLATITVRDGATEETYNLLDERFLATPSYAIEKCVDVCEILAKKTTESVETAFKCAQNYNDELYSRVVELEAQTDHSQDMIEHYLIKASAYDLSASDAQKSTYLLHVVAELESITDYAMNIVRLCKEINTKDIQFSDIAKEELKIMKSATLEIVQLMEKEFVNKDRSIAGHIAPLEDIIDGLKNSLKSRHIARLQAGLCTASIGFAFNDFISSMEKISDCCQTIALSHLQLDKEDLEKHQYMSEQKKTSAKYKERYNKYCEKYALPVQNIN